MNRGRGREHYYIPVPGRFAPRRRRSARPRAAGAAGSVARASPAARGRRDGTPPSGGQAAALALECAETRAQHEHHPQGVDEMANEGYHEPIEELSDETRDMHRAITSLMEELEAVDWYNQRVDACKDDELRAILAHNRDEEKEHAAMVLEWIRRRDPSLDKELKDYLFTDKSIAHD